jgi:hypothetical protein
VENNFMPPSRHLPRALLLATVLQILPVTGNAQEPGDTPHKPFDEVLMANVSDGWVDYNGIAADRRFAAYVQGLERIDAQKFSTRDERLAFWINAYNALAIQGILNGSSPRSFFGKIGFFYNDKYRVGGLATNLYDLEHKILRPLGEPRIHFAIVCASKSCPLLRAEAYAPGRLNEQLEEGARRFINDPSRNRFDREKKVAHLSKIFDWFDEDFAQHSGSVARYVARYVSDPALAEELAAGHYKIKHLDYLWDLNGVSVTNPKN